MKRKQQSFPYAKRDFMEENEGTRVERRAKEGKTEVERWQGIIANHKARQEYLRTRIKNDTEEIEWREERISKLNGWIADAKGE